MADFWRIMATLGILGLALGIFYMLFCGASKQWPISWKWAMVFLGFWMFIGGVVFFALAPNTPERQTGHQVYQVRVIVLSPTGQPVEDARVWSARGGEAKKVPGGWEFEISAIKRAADGQLTLFATQGDLDGGTTVTLGPEAFVAGTIRLKPPAPIQVRGLVQDELGQGIRGAKVTLEETGVVTLTVDNGSFLFPAQPAGKPITLRVEKKTYFPRRQVFKAQDEPFYLQIEKAGS